MKRRSLIQAAVGSALVAPALVGFAQQSITLKYASFVAPQSYVWQNMCKAWMDKVTKESGGRIKFEHYPAMQLGGTPAQLFDQAKDGVADIVLTLPGYTAGRFPRVEAFDLPFIATTPEATSKALWEYTATMAPDEFKDVHLLSINVHGPGVIHTADKPVRSVADMKGLKLRGPTRQTTKLLAALGAVPVGMPLPGIPDAISKGTINGTVIPWEVVPAVKVQELTKYHAEFAPAGGSLYVTSLITAMNKAKYNSLPADLKKVIDANTGFATSGWMGKLQGEGDLPGRKTTADRGNQIYTVGMAEAQEFRRASRQVEVEWMQDMDKRGFDGKKLLSSARSLIEKYSAVKK